MRKEDILYVFRKDQCLNIDNKELMIIKDEADLEDIDDTLVMHFSDEFEQYVKYSLPQKTRKPTRCMSLIDCYDVLDRVHWGTLSFNNDDLPYSIGINHIVVDNKIYFHCAMKGYKLNGINKRASLFVVEDFGGGKSAPTHSYQSVFLLGTLKEVTDFDTKKAALLEIVRHLAPHHPYNDNMVYRTCILELDLEYMSGKTHIY